MSIEIKNFRINKKPLISISVDNINIGVAGCANYITLFQAKIRRRDRFYVWDILKKASDYEHADKNKNKFFITLMVVMA